MTALTHDVVGPFTQKAAALTRKIRMMARSRLGDRQITMVLQRHLRPDSICIDIGAHTGKILRRMCRYAPEQRHFAFEPLPHLAAALRQKFPSAIVVECALSDHSGTDRFLHVRNAEAYSGLRERAYDRPDPILATIVVKVARLDDIIPPDVQVTLIKMDIEGGEYHTMLGGVKTITRSRPVIIFEASDKSTAHYGVSPEMLYDLITLKLELNLSTMRRWLHNEQPFAQAEFSAAYNTMPNFIAYPG
jgi:FkbM family methyltransferase